VLLFNLNLISKLKVEAITNEKFVHYRINQRPKQFLTVHYLIIKENLIVIKKSYMRKLKIISTKAFSKMLIKTSFSFFC